MSKEKVKCIYINCPMHIFEFFEQQAEDELDEDGEVINQITLGRKRNEMIISALQYAIERYEEI
ncbi:hypothetical protein [Methylobacter sp.]|uniref:hypothetical protein n=1 Tax=Methylobacter sp. TaxID=2051955 RepID=UPI003DA1F7C0